MVDIRQLLKNRSRRFEGYFRMRRAPGVIPFLIIYTELDPDTCRSQAEIDSALTKSSLCSVRVAWVKCTRLATPG
jgi:hypothetical protein